MQLTRTLAILLLSLCLGLLFTDEARSNCLAGPELPPDGLMWPAAGKIDQGWSLSCTTDRGHRGIDILLPAETEVRSTAAGVVAFAGYTPAEGGGMTISIDHPGGLRSTYIHLADVSVTKGESVAQEQVLATSDGRALHFAIRSSAGKSYVDPEQHLPPATLETTADVPEGGSPVALPDTPGEDRIMKPVPEPVDVTADSRNTAIEAPVSPVDSRVSRPAELSAPVVRPETAQPRSRDALAAETNRAAAGYHEPQQVVTSGSPELAKKVPAPARATADRQLAWSWPEGLRQIISPAMHDGSKLVNDGVEFNYLVLWPQSEMEKQAGLGLMISTLVLMSIRRLVWGRFQWNEIRTGSTQGDQPSCPGLLH